MTAEELIVLLRTLPPGTIVARMNEGLPYDFKGEIKIMDAEFSCGHYWETYPEMGESADAVEIAIIG
jgi:hypothetical protein